MNREFSRALADCIADMERGASIDDCLKNHASIATEVRPYLENWQAMSAVSPAQPPTAAFDSGRRAMLTALEAAPATFSPLAAVRLAPRWATVAGAVAALILVLGGTAGASAALGGPDPAGNVLSVVGVSTDSDEAHGGIGQSSASDRGLECANPNAFEGSANSEDKSQNADDAHQKEGCSENADEGSAANQTGDTCEDANKGNGNDADHDDADNPGQGQGNNGATDESTGGDCSAGQDTTDENNGHGNDADGTDEGNPGQGQGNGGTNEGNNAGGNANGNANGNVNSNENGQPNDNPNGNGNPNPGEPQGQGGGPNKP
jgi:hypothetical protein